MRLLQALLAFASGAVAALLWLERRTAPSPPSGPPPRPTTPPPPQAPPEPERIVEEVVVPDPQQAERIAALEAELAEQRAIRATAPDEPPPSVDAIRAARMRTLELERRLSSEQEAAAPRWFELDPPPPAALVDAVAEHLPRVALQIDADGIDGDELWPALGAMQEFAEASGGAWFEFDGDFARWCAESGHPHALDPALPGLDDSRPSFHVPPQVNRSGRQLVPTYVQVGESRLYYVDDVAGETGRMHVVGAT